MIVVGAITAMQQARLAVSPRSTATTQCRPINITCVVKDLTFLIWFFDGTQIGMPFAYSDTNTYPENVYSARNVDINVIEAVPEFARSDVFNATSVLASNTLALSLLDVNGIHCGTNEVSSDIFNLSLINIPGE